MVQTLHIVPMRAAWGGSAGVFERDHRSKIQLASVHPETFEPEFWRYSYGYTLST